MNESWVQSKDMVSPKGPIYVAPALYVYILSIGSRELHKGYPKCPSFF